MKGGIIAPGGSWIRFDAIAVVAPLCDYGTSGSLRLAMLAGAVEYLSADDANALVELRDFRRRLVDALTGAP